NREIPHCFPCSRPFEVAEAPSQLGRWSTAFLVEYESRARNPPPAIAAGCLGRSTMSQRTFPQEDRETLYRIIQARRDVRHFVSTPVPPDVLWRILEAAHHAPSVGFMQPWNFILVTSVDTRRRVRASFEARNQDELAKLPPGERKELYRRLKLEGIL